ncbi:hypothetical protein GVAV_000086 [Gurleya vavrai]
MIIKPQDKEYAILIDDCSKSINEHVSLTESEKILEKNTNKKKKSKNKKQTIGFDFDENLITESVVSLIKEETKDNFKNNLKESTSNIKNTVIAMNEDKNSLSNKDYEEDEKTLNSDRLSTNPTTVPDQKSEKTEMSTKLKQYDILKNENVEKSQNARESKSNEACKSKKIKISSKTTYDYGQISILNQEKETKVVNRSESIQKKKNLANPSKVLIVSDIAKTNSNDLNSIIASQKNFVDAAKNEKLEPEETKKIESIDIINTESEANILIKAKANIKTVFENEKKTESTDIKKIEPGAYIKKESEDEKKTEILETKKIDSKVIEELDIKDFIKIKPIDIKKI